jgi:hypothetical protein
MLSIYLLLPLPPVVVLVIFCVIVVSAYETKIESNTFTTKKGYNRLEFTGGNIICCQMNTDRSSTHVMFLFLGHKSKYSHDLEKKKASPMQEAHPLTDKCSHSSFCPWSPIWRKRESWRQMPLPGICTF